MVAREPLKRYKLLFIIGHILSPTIRKWIRSLVWYHISLWNWWKFTNNYLLYSFVPFLSKWLAEQCFQMKILTNNNYLMQFFLYINERNQMSNRIFVYDLVLWISCLWLLFFNFFSSIVWIIIAWKAELNRNKRIKLEQQRNDLKKNQLHI